MIFHQMVGICMGPFFDSSRDVAMATNFGQIWQTKFRSAPWHFEMDWNITMLMNGFVAPMIPLHHVQTW